MVDVFKPYLKSTNTKRKPKKSQDRANHYYVMIRLNPGDEITKHKIDFKNDIY